MNALRADLQAVQSILSSRQRELDQLRGTAASAMYTLRGQLEQVERSAAWRYGHAVTRNLARLRRRRVVTAGGVAAAIGQVDRILELIGAPPSSAPGRAVTASSRPAIGRIATERELEGLGRLLGETLGPTELAATPPVSIVVVSRSPERVRRLLAELAGLEYPSFEVVMVDNASEDEGVADAAESVAQPAVQTVRTERPLNFAEACNRGAELAQGELLLFLNDDIRGPEPRWLAELANSLSSTGAAVAGATLVDPRLEDSDGGWVLEQRGVEIGIDAELFSPIRRDAGAELFGPGLGTDVDAVAVSGACLLISAAVFRAIGGFDTGYQFGLEDVDLCLRARAHGHKVVSSGRSVVVHEGSGSQREAGREFRRINRAVNRRRFRHLWGPALWRQRLTGLLRGEPEWGDGPHVGIARSSNDLDRGWGDYYTARELGEAAAELGWRVTFLAYDEQPAPIPVDLDLAIVLTDRWDAREFQDTTVMFAWIRNWTERWLTRPWLDRYDVLLASSKRSADLLAQATARPTEAFPLATNPERFAQPPGGTGRTLDWVFTGNRWGEPRAIEPALTELTGLSGAVYGRNWGQVRALRELARGAAEYDQLPAIYGDAKIVIDDTAEPTLIYDAVNARVFDALACGALPLTNCAGGVHELFDEEFPTWSSPQQAARRVHELIADPEHRSDLVSRYRNQVVSHHTYMRRIERVRELALAHSARLSFCIKIGAPDRVQAERWGDLHFAASLGRALRRLGHSWRVDPMSDWDAPMSSNFDVVIHLRGRSDYAPAPGQFNVLWLISHPDTFDEATAAGYDLVCVASEPFAQALAGRIDTPVRVLEQATDPQVFFPDPDPALAHELVFVGNSRGVKRKILEDLLPTEHDLAIWGGGWRETPVQRYVAGDYLDNEAVRKVYSSAAVVLCDHWPDMRAAGFRSNRLYDALACGSVVVSDRVAGLDGSLGGGVVTYEDQHELRELIEGLLRDPQERARRGAGGRERVLRDETFDNRASDLIVWVQSLADV